MIKKTIKTYQEAEEFFKDFNKNCFSFDTETNGLNYYTMEMESIQFCDGKKCCFIEHPYTFSSIIHELFINSKLLIAHNIPFDLKVIKKCLKIELPESVELYDTMVAQHLLNENGPKALKTLAKTLLGKEVISYEEAKKIGGDTFIEYGMNDAIWTWELAQYQRPLLESEGLVPLMREIEMPFQRCMLDMATNGVLINIDKLAKFTIDTKQAIEDLRVKMLDNLGEKYEFQVNLFGESNIISPINFNSSITLCSILFTKLKLPIIEETPSGKPSVGKRTIEELSSKSSFVNLLAKYKKACKLYSSFLLPLPEFIDGDGRVRPDFKDTGTKTGRLSCSKPNLQQLARPMEGLPNFREVFIVPKGKKMIACDYSGQELRVLTQLTRSDSLIETFIKGKDLHLSTANDFFELEIPEEALYTDNKDFKKYKEMYYESRTKAKIINFGMAYGKGAYGFSKDFNITEAEAQHILDKYFGALPKVKQAIDNCHAEISKKGYTKSMTNRRRRFFKNEQGYYPNSAFRQAFNFQIQGTSADMMRKALIEVRKYSLRHTHFNIKLLYTVHDEGVWECDEEYAERVALKIKSIFEEDVAKFVIPIKADVEVGNNYSDIK